MRRLTATAIVLLALVLSACATASPSPGGAVATPTPAPSAPAPAPTPVVDVPVSSAAIAPAAEPVPPTRVQIGAVGIDIPVVPVGIESDGFMEIPEDPAIAGWYRYGPDARATAGNIVITAHIDWPDYPIGPFASLPDVPVGAEIFVEAADGSTGRWIAESVTYYRKTDLPVDQIFARDGATALVLITCGGDFDSATGRYTDNVVLIARPVT